MMKKIAVTGATSMIGVALIEKAIHNDVEVIAIARDNSPGLARLPQSDLISIVYCDINGYQDLEITDSCEVFYHFAWEGSDPSGRNETVIQARNISATLSAVELAHRMGADRFVGAGSQAEYGYVSGVISEDTPVNPVIPYGIAKLSAGKLAEIRCKQLGIKYVWGRVFSVYGRYDRSSSMIMYAIDSFLSGEEPRFSAGTQYWNYLNERDAGSAFYQLGDSDKAGGVYCIADSINRPLKDYIAEIADECDNVTCRYADDAGKVYGLQTDISRLSVDTGFEPQISFRDGIREIIRYKKGINSLYSV